MNRKGFIGGSDAVKIMAGDWYQLWKIKTGRVESDDLSRNLAVQMGVLTEDFNLAWFEHEYDKLVHQHQLEIKRKAPLKGTIDGMVKGTNAIIEAKHTYSGNNMESVIDYYMAQIQFYCYLAEADGCYLSVLFGNNKWQCSYISYSDSYIATMLDSIKEFWGYVERDEEPVNYDIPLQVSIDKILVDDMVRRDASFDNQFMDAAITYTQYQQHNVVFENAKKSLKEMVADNEREVYCDQISIRRDKRGSLRINTRKEK